VTVKRGGTEKQFTAKLRNKMGDTGIVRDSNELYGAQFEVLSERDKSEMNIDHGIKTVKVNDGKLKNAGLVKGFVITDVNKKPVYDVDDFKRILSNASGGILIEGVLPGGEPAYFVFGIK
jgi:serine protease Do